MTSRLIIAFDVGTTFSGASYAFQDGSSTSSHPPEIHGVTRFPGFMGADSKIPSQILYRVNPSPEPYRFGAEVDEYEQGEHEDDYVGGDELIKVQWFKILLRPGLVSPPSEVKTQLPVETNAVQVFADYLKYLHDCTMKFIKETHVNSSHLLNAVGPNIHYILTHPNGWVGPQQARIRVAAHKAGLVPTPEDCRLHLLTEGEASINFCVQQGLTGDLMSNEDGVAVIDAGGGTIDISAYRGCSVSNKSDKNQKPKLEEITDARCLMQGSIFVTRNAEQYLQKKLEHFKFKGDLDHIAREFDRFAKIRFRTPDRVLGFQGIPPYWLRIKLTQLRKEMAKFFEPSIEAIVDTFKDIKNSPKTRSRALLVGGFAGSEYLYMELNERLKPLGIELYRPDRHLNKAVADGAIAYYLHRTVVARVVKHTLGTECQVRYEADNEEHRKRFVTHSYISKEDGFRWVRGAFRPIIAKGTAVKDSENPTEYTREFVVRAEDGKFGSSISSDIVEYRGNLPGTQLQWVDAEPTNYNTLCTIEQALGQRTLDELAKLPKITGDGGKRYAEYDHHISLALGAPELTAHGAVRYRLPYKRKHVEIKSELRIVYFDRDDEPGGED